MRVTRSKSWPRILPALMLLILAPVYAHAQNFTDGWYNVNAEQLTVRNKAKQLVMGTLTNNTWPGKNRVDRFYIYYWDTGLTYAWGYADGEGFKGCGWVGVKSKLIGKKGYKINLVREQAPPPPPGRCGHFPFINPSKFAQPIPQKFTPRSKGRRYTNLTPKDDGSGASVTTPTQVFGNYSSAGRATLLRFLNGGHVRWRYFTKDQKYVMVGVGSSRNRRGRSFGDWGFVRCKDIKPHPSDRKDAAIFYDMCK